MSQPSPKAAKCAVCGKPQDTRLRPFCSKRCADVDLGRWLGGGYAIPAVEPPDGSLAPEPDEGE
jgi:endogenous inhibitor of DNA gyrase (YacG/DUF329 family)